MQSIIVIPDSFKGALSSREAGSAIAAGLASVTDAEVLVVPIADGGEGTVEAFVAAAGGALRSATVCGVFYGERVPVHYGLVEPDVAVVETASCRPSSRLRTRGHGAGHDVRGRRADPRRGVR